MTATATAQNYSETVENLKKVVPAARIEYLNLDDIYVDKSDNIRRQKSYREEEIDALAKDIDNVGGLLQPIGVYEIADDADTMHKKYALAYGFRRTLSLIQLAETNPERWATNVPAVILPTITDKATLTMVQLMENLSRKNINALEKALAMKTSLEDGTVKQQDVAQMLNISPESVSQHLRLLEMPAEFQEALEDERLSFSNCRTLIYSKVPAKDWPQLFKQACDEDKSTFQETVRKLEASYGANDTSGPDADGKSKKKNSSQREQKVLRGSDITSHFIPFLKGKLSQVKEQPLEAKYTEADMIQARLDTLATVTLEANTQLGADIKPYLEEQEKAEKSAEEQEKSVKASAAFWRTKTKDVRAILNAPVDPANPDAPRPSLAVAYTTVIKRIYQMAAEDRKSLNSKDDKGADVKTELGFTLPEKKEDALKLLVDAYQTSVKEAKDRADAAKKAKEEKAAKEKATAAQTKLEDKQDDQPAVQKTDA